MFALFSFFQFASLTPYKGQGTIQSILLIQKHSVTPHISMSGNHKFLGVTSNDANGTHLIFLCFRMVEPRGPS
jgi:hypothetical protein